MIEQFNAALEAKILLKIGVVISAFIGLIGLGPIYIGRPAKVGGKWSASTISICLCNRLVIHMTVHVAHSIDVTAQWNILRIILAKLHVS